jgi:hypothetical protein
MSRTSMIRLAAAAAVIGAFLLAGGLYQLTIH